MDDLPYRAEYAKSGRASCKSCKGNIAKDVLRLAALVKSPMFDGKMATWYHVDCFFVKQRPKSIDDIADIDNLRFEDQEKIKKMIESSLAGGVAAEPKKGKKRGAGAVQQNDFDIEYAKSGRAVCRGCEQKIIKDEVRISKKDFESDAGKRYGGVPLWHHVECFAKLRDSLAFWAAGSEIPGFQVLSEKDKETVLNALPATTKKTSDETDCPGPSKKAKSEELTEEEQKELKKQNKLIYRIRDQLKASLQKKELCALLEHNKLVPPPGHDNILDRVSDILAFGIPRPCSECKNGELVFRAGVGYQCQGDLTEWVKCQNKVLDPERKAPKIPGKLKEQYDFLADYQFKPRKRAVRLITPTVAPATVTAMMPTKSEPVEDEKPRVERDKPPLYNMEFVILGKTNIDKDVLKKDIQKLGAKVGSKIHDKVFAVISNQDELDRMGKRMEDVKESQIDVVTEDFVKEVADGGAPLTLVKTKAISSWGSDPAKRIHEEKPKSKSRSGSMFAKSGPDKVMLKVKGGVAVDPDSGLQDEAHVYRSGKEVYTCVLSATDIQTDKNSYYKLQILQSDKGSKIWVFRAWGRIGTTIGGNKLEKMHGINEAIENFEALFLDKTGNHWRNRRNCNKIPGKFFPVEISYGEEEGEKKKQVLTSSKVQSKLAKPVQSLIEMLFDVDTMKKCMMEFELDLQKMPLGKISSKQILKAMGVLKELQMFLESDSKDGLSGPNAHARLVDGSNRFYTLIPHDFGVEVPTVLCNLEMIQGKIAMLESLLELEIAYNMLDAGGDEQDVHPVDTHYRKLKADIEVLERTSQEFIHIEKYLKNSHAETHTQFELELEEVFKVKRQGEERRYKPFKKLHNRQLLWHGSRLTNFVGIISQGLRIAPPEAPACGYMFGKGIYFADRVSKSANYCMTTKKNPTGLMLLCEVALGDMHERLQADYIEKLPKGKHSCKGVGRTEPDGGVDLDDGVHIPLGPGKTNDDPSKSLLYNEYIVYDVAQVHMKYLLKVNFKYK